MSPLRLAVVGHTNTGKTSLLQTLLRRRDFGEVRPSPGTTRAVEAGEVVDDDGVIAVLLDTPGFEEPDRLRDAIESARIDRRDDPRTLLDRFLVSPAAADDDDLGLEAASVRAALDADVLLYAIDARSEPKPRHRDELAVLAATARPLVPVLNYTARPDAHPTRWEDECARQGLHATVAFDAVVYDDAGERRVLAAVKALASGQDAAIERWTAVRERERQKAIVAATEVAAEFLVTAAAAVVVSTPKERTEIERRVAVEAATALLLDELRRCETDTRDRIAATFGFFGVEARSVTFDVAEALGGVDFLSRASLERTGLWAAGTGAGPRGGRRDGRHRRWRRIAGRFCRPRCDRSGARHGRGEQPEGASSAPGTGRGAARRRRRGVARRPGRRHHPGHAGARSRGGRAGLDRVGGEGKPRWRRRPGLEGIVGIGARAGRLERSFPATPARRRRTRPRRDRQESNGHPRRPHPRAPRATAVAGEYQKAWGRR